MHATLACVNVALGILALSVGGHALDWSLREAADRVSRVSSFELSARVHMAMSLGLLVLALPAVPATLPFLLVAVLCAGTAVFCCTLYAHGLFGITWAMPGTVIGCCLMVFGWVGIALALDYPPV